MTVLLGNWELILFAFLLVVVGVLKVSDFLNKPSEKRQELMLTWLIQAVTVAEKKFGSKTGKIKLSYVYHLFLDKYGFLGMFITQEIFEELVEKALRIMEETLSQKESELPK